VPELAPPDPVDDPVVELDPPAASFVPGLGSPEPHPTITAAMATMTATRRKVKEGITTYFGSERDAFGQAQTRSRNEVNYVSLPRFRSDFIRSSTQLRWSKYEFY
jgi:hypothetical protein